MPERSERLTHLSIEDNDRRWPTSELLGAGPSATPATGMWGEVVTRRLLGGAAVSPMPSTCSVVSSSCIA